MFIRNLQVRTKIVGPVIIALVLVTLGIMTTVTLEFKNYSDKVNDDAVGVSSRVLKMYLEDLELISMSSADAVAISGDMGSALQLAGSLRVDSPDKQDGSTASAHAHALAVLDEILKETDVTIAVVTDENGIVLASTIDDNYGYTLSSLSIKTAIEGDAVASVEISDLGMVAVAGVPIRDKNHFVIGAVLAGYDLADPDLVDEIKSLTGTEVTIFQGDTRLMTTVKNDKNQRAIGTQAKPEVSKRVLGGLDYTGYAEVLGKRVIGHYMPLKSAEGEVLGMAFAGQYTETSDKVEKNFMLMGVVVALIIATIFTVIVLHSSKTITNPIAMMMAYLTQISRTGSLNFTQAEWAATRKEMVYKDEISMSLSAFVEMLEHFIYYGEFLVKGAKLDFSQEIKILSERDTFGHGIQEMINGISVALKEVQQAANQMNTSAGELTSASQNLAEDASTQAQSVETLAVSVKGIKETADLNASIANDALSGVISTDEYMQECMSSMDDTVRAMNEINKGSNSIRAVIKTIDDIAFQTNILALNAAVEAARAGAHGKGFAVVAEEVRNLASKSAAAAKETAELIESNAKKAGDGIKIVESVNEKLREVADTSKRNAHEIEKITHASIEQKNSIDAVSAEIEQMSGLIQSNSATAQEVAAQSRVMSENSDGLKGIVTRFKIR